MTVDRERLERLLGGERLADLRRRLARLCHGTDPGRLFMLGGLADAERDALQGLLGRPMRASRSMRLTRQALDAALARAGVAPDLHSALEALDGPLVDSAALRAQREWAWGEVFGAVSEPSLKHWLQKARNRGLVKRLAGADPESARQMLGQVAAVVECLPGHGRPLAQLAAEALGDAHALDVGQPVATLVLRCVAVDADPENEPEWHRARNRWARLGVAVNELAKPVLVLNLPARRQSPAGCFCNAAASSGEPVHLSLRALLRWPVPWDVRGREVYVCENPSVISVIADRHGPHAAPMVCTDGMPAAAQRALLAQLRDGGARLFYHGDYDWDGIRIANFIMRCFLARPWCFDAHHYRPREGGRRLSGTPVQARWDPALAARMQQCGWAVEEESVLDELIRSMII